MAPLRLRVEERNHRTTPTATGTRWEPARLVAHPGRMLAARSRSHRSRPGWSRVRSGDLCLFAFGEACPDDDTADRSEPITLPVLPVCRPVNAFRSEVLVRASDRFLDPSITITSPRASFCRVLARCLGSVGCCCSAWPSSDKSRC